MREPSNRHTPFVMDRLTLLLEQIRTRLEMADQAPTKERATYILDRAEDTYNMLMRDLNSRLSLARGRVQQRPH